MHAPPAPTFEPYRALFPMGLAFALLGAVVWPLHALGTITHPGPLHVAVMVQGFEQCFVLGFLLTAMPAFTHGPRCAAWELASAVVAMAVFGAGALAGLLAIAQGAFLLSIVLLAIAGVRRVAGNLQKPPEEFLFVAFGLVLGGLGSALLLAGALGSAPPLPFRFAERLVSLGMVLSLVMGVGSLLVPTFAGMRKPLEIRGVAGPHERRGRRVLYAILILAFALAFVAELGGLAAAGMALRAATVTTIGIWVWKLTRLPRRDAPGFALWSSGWMVLAGTWTAVLWPGHVTAGLHVAFIGGFGLLTMGIGTRVVVAHGKHPLETERRALDYGVLALFAAALVFRLRADLLPERAIHSLAGSSFFWLLAWLLWALRALPLVVRRRALMVAVPLAIAILAGCAGKVVDPPATPPACQVAPMSLDFGSIGVGQSVDRTFSVTNGGGGTLSGTVSEACAEFELIGVTTYALGHGQQATFTIRFTPGDAGPEACTVSSGSTACASLGCTGQGAGPTPACSVTPEILDFGSVRIGQTVDRTFTITNAGAGTLTGTVSEACADFELVGAGTYDLGAGQSATFTIRFAPTGTGPSACAVGSGSACSNVGCSGIGNGGDGAWSQILPAGGPPGKREQLCMVLDPAGDRLVLFGGSSFTASWDDAWSLDLSGQPQWTQLQPQGTGPTARVGATGIYDSARRRMIVYGGIAGGTALGDVWALSLDATPAWTEIAAGGTPPPPRTAHSAIYDPLRDRMVVFGGWSNTSPFYDDVWELSLGGTPTWTRRFPAGPAPDPRIGHETIYDPLRDRMILFGGNVGGAPASDIWALSLGAASAWSPMTPTGSGPGGRIGHSAIYDEAGDRMVIFGGAFPNDTWALPLSAGAGWTLLQPTGTPTPERNWQAAVYDAARARLIMFGGRDVFALPNEGLNDTWVLTW